MGNVPLVVSAKGEALRTLADCPVWLGLYEKERRAQKIRKRAGGMVYTTISSDSEGPGDSHLSHPVVKRTEKAKSSQYIDPSDLSSSESEDEEPKSSKKKANKKRSHSQHMSGSEDASRQARKRKKDSQEKGRSKHNPDGHRKKSKKAKRRHDGKDATPTEYIH
jgi:hypothetical protein